MSMEELQSKLTAELAAVEKDCVRPRQKEALQCSVRCCDQHARDSSPALNTCFERCSAGLVAAQSMTQQYLADFENRMQRCVARCQDTATAHLRQAAGTADVAQHDPAIKDAQKLMDTCVDACVTEFQAEVGLLGKQLRKNIKSVG